MTRLNVVQWLQLMDRHNAMLAKDALVKTVETTVDSVWS